MKNNIFKDLNPEALEDWISSLYRYCSAAATAYGIMALLGADNHLPGYNKCLEDLQEAIRKAEKEQND